MKYHITPEGLDYIEELRSAKQVGKDTEEQEFDKGVYGFQSDLTGTIKGHDARKLRAQRLRKTRLRRWAKAIAKATDPFSDVGEGSPKSRKMREAKKKKKGDERDEEGGRGEEGDEAVENLLVHKRIKFLQRKK